MKSSNDATRGALSFSLDRPVTILMLVCAVTLVGAIATTLVPVELAPKGFLQDSITISIPVPSSNPTEILNQVIRPVEEQLRTVPGIAEITSRARSDQARLSVSFSRGVDQNLAVAEIRDRMERARTQWPADVRNYRIFRFNLDTDLPIVAFAIDLLDRTGNDVSLYVEENVIKRVEALPGVAQVQAMGILEDQVRIQVDLARAQSLGIPIYNLTQTLRASNVEVSGGEVEADGTRLLVRTDSRFTDLESLRRFPVSKDGVLLGDIAEVTMMKGIRDSLSLSRNQRSLWCQVNKESSANTVATARLVRQFLEDEIVRDPILAQMGCRVRIYDEMDQGQIITNALGTLRGTALIGAGLATLILFFFLRRLGPTILITASIPLSLLLTIIWIHFSGGSLNILSMLGITISVGMLIDNSIVVVENIFRHRELGLSRVEAARVGVSEVGLAITLSTLTTVAAFLPIIFMGGNANITFFTSAIGLPLCVAVLGSLLVALVFIPLGTVVFSPKLEQGSTSWWARPPELRRCRSVYSRVLRVALGNRLAAVLLVGLFVGVVSSLAMKRVPRVDLVSDRGGSLAIQVELDKNFSLADADREMKFLGQYFEERMDQYGITHHWCWYSRRGGRLSLTLKNRNIEKTRALAKQLKQEIPARPGVRLDMGVVDGAPEDRGKLTLDVFGPDAERLRQISEEIGRLCSAVDGVLSVRLDSEQSDEEIQIRPRRAETARFGADPRVVRGTLEYGIRGFRFGDLLVNEKEIPLIIEYDTAGTIDLQELRELQIPTDRGGIQPLSALADVQVTRGVGEIRRTNGQTRSRITVETTEGQGGETANRLRAALSGYELPNGYRYFETSQDDMKETQKEMTSAVILAVTLVFLLMGIMFESFILPLAVVIAIPFSWAGLLWALAATRIPLDMIGSIGVIVLVGVVVNNGIVLIDRARRNMDEGLERTAALVDAGLTRFRPIIMTAGTTVVGLLPMAVAESSSQISYRALSVALIGGLLVSTFFTLVFVPLLFSLFDDLRTLFFRALVSLRASP